MSVSEVEELFFVLAGGGRGALPVRSPPPASGLEGNLVPVVQRINQAASLSGRGLVLSL